MISVVGGRNKISHYIQNKYHLIRLGTYYEIQSTGAMKEGTVPVPPNSPCA